MWMAHPLPAFGTILPGILGVVVFKIGKVLVVDLSVGTVLVVDLSVLVFSMTASTQLAIGLSVDQ